MMYGSRKTLELLDEEQIAMIKNEGIFDDIDAKLIEITKERQKLFDQRREYKKLIVGDARKEHLYGTIANIARSIGRDNAHMYNSVAPAAITGNEAILVLSDWHFGLKTTNVFNEYNTDICHKRVIKIITKAVDKLITHQCNVLHIVVLGDLFHGAIHNSARVASEEHTCDQIMHVSEILAQSIEHLSQCVNQTFVHMTYGNHARTIQNKNDSIHRDNLERLVPWWLQHRLSSYDNITICPDEGHEFIFINSCGHEFCATHGDNDSVRTAPRVLPTLFQKQFGKNIEYILLGDKHHRESFDEMGVSAFLCGSLCGTDDYANNKRLYSTPSQLLLIVNQEEGVDAEYRLKAGSLE